jgi:hypothetical protein
MAVKKVTKKASGAKKPKGKPVAQAGPRTGSDNVARKKGKAAAKKQKPKPKPVAQAGPRTGSNNSPF